MDCLSYKKSGVDIEKADRMLDAFSNFLRSRPRDRNVVSGIGGFASCYDLAPFLNTIEHPIMVTCCDGVGTKIKLALDWNHLTGLGHDLVAMNVNDCLCCGAMPILFLDYFACGALREEFGLELLKDIQGGCELAECALVGGETAEMPGMYAGKDFDLAGFCVGIVDRHGTLGPHKVSVGDRLLALASSGPHSNGFSLIRQLVSQEKLNPDDTPPFGGPTWKEVLLKPTTIYVPYVKDAMPSINAMAHITGGGLFENLPRVLPDGTLAVISASKWTLPPVFQWIQNTGGLTLRELLLTLNCGVGMIAVVGNELANSVAADITSKGISCWEIGQIQKGTEGQPAAVVWG